MATIQKFLVYDVSSDAYFDSIGLAIYNSIVTTFGWVEKTDAGRTDWTTNPARPGAGSYLWNVFGPNDALQTGATVYYVKLEIGLDGSSRLSIRMQIGTSTNGAGTLTGTLSTLLYLPGTGGSTINNQGATTYECNFSGDTGRWGMMLWRYGPNYIPHSLFIERTLDTAGAPSSDGVSYVATSGSDPGSCYTRQQTLVFGVGPGNLSGSPVCLGVTHSSGNFVVYSDVFNNSVPISPVFPSYGKFGNPMTVVGSLRSSDCPEGAILQTTLYGQTRYYMCSGGGRFNVFGPVQSGTVDSGCKLAMRWD